jgi:hypothetical protein
MAKAKIEFTVPSNPADRKKIRDRISEMSAALQRIEDSRSFMKDVATSLKDDFKLPPKIAMKMARTLHKHDYVDLTQETETFSLTYETIFQDVVGSGDQD